MNTVLPFLSTVVSFVFAGVVFAQWLSRRKVHQLVWTLGLLAFGIATGIELVSAISSWSDLLYRLWYLFGALLVAAYLGMGTVYLLAPRKVAHGLMAILILASLFFTLRVFSAEVNVALLSSMHVPTSEAMAQEVRSLTFYPNIFGTAGLVGGALYSAWIFWRKRILRARLISCLLIALGGILPAIGGTRLRLGNPDLLLLLEFLGVTIIFIGFLANSEIVAVRVKGKSTAPAS